MSLRTQTVNAAPAADTKRKHTHFLTVFSILFLAVLMSLAFLPLRGTALADPADPTLSSSISAAGKVATKDAPIELSVSEAQKVTISDQLSYTGLEAGAQYKLTSTLVLLKDGKNYKRAQSEKLLSPQASAGTEKVEFKKVNTLIPGLKAVVWEKLVKLDEKGEVAGDPIIHEDNDDNLASIIVKPAEIKKLTDERGAEDAATIKGSYITTTTSIEGLKADPNSGAYILNKDQLNKPVKFIQETTLYNAHQTVDGQVTSEGTYYVEAQLMHRNISTGKSEPVGDAVTVGDPDVAPFLETIPQAIKAVIEFPEITLDPDSVYYVEVKDMYFGVHGYWIDPKDGKAKGEIRTKEWIPLEESDPLDVYSGSVYFLNDTIEKTPIPVKTGTFQEHHYYFDKLADMDDLSKATQKVDSPVLEGTAADSYETAQQAREGYLLQKVSSSSQVAAQFDENGKKVSAHFVPKEALEVSYYYVKTIPATLIEPAPAKPAQPAEPSEPNQPAKPAQPAKKPAKGKQIPKTGDASAAALVPLLVSGITALVGSATCRRKR